MLEVIIFMSYFIWVMIDSEDMLAACRLITKLYIELYIELYKKHSIKCDVKV